jgi:hypothetical protein
MKPVRRRTSESPDVHPCEHPLAPRYQHGGDCPRVAFLRGRRLWNFELILSGALGKKPLNLLPTGAPKVALLNLRYDRFASNPAPTASATDASAPVKRADGLLLFWCPLCKDTYALDPADPRCPCGARPGE